MTGLLPRCAIIGVRANEHSPPRIIGDHLIQIAMRRPAKIAWVRGLGCLKRVVLEIKADNAGKGRDRVNPLLATRGRTIGSGAFQFGVANFAIRKDPYITPSTLPDSLAWELPGRSLET